MSRKGISEQPCHGCGKAIPHRTGSVCQYCADAIQGYNLIMAERKATPDTVVMYSKQVAHALPYIDVDVEQRAAIQTGFMKIVGMVSTPAGYDSKAPSIFDYSKQNSSVNLYDWNDYVRIRADHAKLIGDTYSAIDAAVRYAYANGHRRGRDLLSQLASGQITSDQYNTTATRQEGGIK